MTEQINHAKLYEAMAKFQGEYESPKKDKKVDYKTKQGQQIKYDYSDLESLQKAIRTTASKHGLSWNVDFEYKDTEITNYGKTQKALMIIANVVINHSSGAEKIFKGIPLYATSFDPQSIGSIKTYSERYALSGAFGIASGEDDDGQIAKDKYNNQSNDKQQEQPQQQQNNRPPAQQQQQTPDVEAAIVDYVNKFKSAGVDVQKIYDYIAQKEGVESVTDVDKVRIFGYMKAQYLKMQKNQQQPNQQQQPPNQEQGSLLEGRTTKPSNEFAWGSK